MKFRIWRNDKGKPVCFRRESEGKEGEEEVINRKEKSLMNFPNQKKILSLQIEGFQTYLGEIFQPHDMKKFLPASRDRGIKNVTHKTTIILQASTSYLLLVKKKKIGQGLQSTVREVY